MKVFFAILTGLLIISMAVWGIRSVFSGDEECLSDERTTAEDNQLNNVQLMTLGILSIGGFFCLRYSYWLVFSIQSFAGRENGLDFFVPRLIGLLFSVLLICLAPLFARYLGWFRKSWSESTGMFRAYLLSILLGFSCVVLTMELPVVLINGISFYERIHSLIVDWSYGEHFRGFFRYIGSSELLYFKSVCLTLFGLMIVGFRRKATDSLTNWFGVIYPNE